MSKSNSVTRFTARMSFIASSLSLALGAALFMPVYAGAQQGVLLQGVVSDESTGELIASATVTLVGTGREIRADAYGTFQFPDLSPGPISVRVQAPGYATVVENSEVTPGATVIMQVQLLNIYQILGILVEARPPVAARASDRLLEGAKTAADLLARQVPDVLPNAGDIGKKTNPIRLRGVQSIMRSSEPVLFLDGVRVGGDFGEAMDILAGIPASEVREVRVLRGPAAAFLEGLANGAIYVETRLGPDLRRGHGDGCDNGDGC